MLKTLEEELPEGVKFTRPSGGLFTWLELPENIDASELLKKCLENNVAYVSGEAFLDRKSVV